jgi:RHS repeat-associated protein
VRFLSPAPTRVEGSLGEGPIRILPGQYLDKETGLAYNYFRDYDPQTGRYVQSDPIGLAGGINTYLYVNGTPTTYSDPPGKNPAIIAGAVLGGISGFMGAIASSGCKPINWWKVGIATLVGAGAGAAIGAFAPAVLVTGGASAFVDTAVANVGIQVASSVAGNAIGQGVSYATDPAGTQFNAGSLAGSAVAGAFAGTMSVGAAVARAEGLASGSVAGRLAAGTPGVIGAAGISAENAPSGCGCQ